MGRGNAQSAANGCEPRILSCSEFGIRLLSGHSSAVLPTLFSNLSWPHYGSCVFAMRAGLAGAGCNYHCVLLCAGAKAQSASPTPVQTPTATSAAVTPQAPVASPAGEPTSAWLGSTPPVLQVGPDGAVQLDQPVMMMPNPAMGAQYYGGQYYYAGQPVVAAPGPPAAPYAPYGVPYGAQPAPYQQQPLVQPQPAWDSWLTSPQGLAGGPTRPFFIHRTSVYGEFLYLRPRDAEVAYALPIDGPVAPVLGNEVPVGAVAVVDPDFDISFRAGFNIAIDQGSSIAAQFTRLDSGTTDSVTVTAPTILRSLVSHPLGANAATDTLDAAAALDITLDQIDLDFRSLWYGCECNYAYAVNYRVGAAYSRLEQDFASTFATLGTTTVNTALDFTGVGMRFGMDAERLWPRVNLFVYGTGTANFLFGEFDANYVQANSQNGTEAFTSWSAGRIVPVLDLEFGAGWLGVNRHLRLSAGYRVSTWFNVVKTDDWIWAVQNHDFRNLDGTLTFDGLVGRAEWLF